MRLVVDGVTKTLADGKTIDLSTGVQITRQGDSYTVSADNGNRMTAMLEPQWINVTVGLGRSPASESRGLLGNPRGNGRELKTSKGEVFNEPVSFNQLYRTYAESWRVKEKQSLFTDPEMTKFGAPSSLFYATDIDPQLAGPARAACQAAGITNRDLLEACTLDTVVLNDKAAIRVFIHALPPLHLIKPVQHIEPLRR
jgi:hypothetical protein